MIEAASRVLFHNICTVLSCIIEPETKGKNPDGYKPDFSAFATWLRAWYRHGKARADELSVRLSECIIPIRKDENLRETSALNRSAGLLIDRKLQNVA